jgi:hypothetical protein
VPGMTSQAGPGRDAAHLDEDAECLEDPVHCGDARHQHDVHSSPAAAVAVEPDASAQA